MNNREQKIVCRKAMLADMKLYYNWANDAEVRRNSLIPKLISWKIHKSWFLRKLKDRNSALYIFEKDKNPLGQVRFDRKKNIVKISYSVGKKFRGLGYGKKILNMAIKQYKPKTKTILIGLVKFKNFSSIKIFKSLNFKRTLKNKIYYFKKNYG